MADYLSFAGRIPISNSESSDSKQELNMVDLTLEEEPIVQFNNPNVDSESLATALVPVLEASRKRSRDLAPDEEELIKGSGLFVKLPWIPECPDTRKWILKNMVSISFQSPDIRD